MYALLTPNWGFFYYKHLLKLTIMRTEQINVYMFDDNRGIDSVILKDNQGGPIVAKLQ